MARPHTRGRGKKSYTPSKTLEKGDSSLEDMDMISIEEDTNKMKEDKHHLAGRLDFIIGDIFDIYNTLTNIGTYI